MPPVPSISESEWEVMKALWDHGPLTSGQVAEHAAGDRGWAPRTVKTLLARLVRKGAVSARSVDSRRLYWARVRRDAVARIESRSFLRRVFDGAVTPALVHLIQEANLTPGEVDELRRVLNREIRHERH